MVCIFLVLGLRPLSGDPCLYVLTDAGHIVGKFALRTHRIFPRWLRPALVSTYTQGSPDSGLSPSGS